MPSVHESFPLVLRRPLRWRDAPGGLVELHDPKRDSWARLVPWTRDVFRGLEGGEGVPALLDRVGAQREASLRRLLHSLASVGYLDIQVPAPVLLAERFEVVEELGRGGVGIAYRALDRESLGHVVVKRAWGFIHDIRLAEAALAQEEANLRALDHPCVVRFVSSFREQDRAHLARSLAPGRSLTAAYDAAPADAPTTLRVARDVGAALAHFHARSMLLLDHKPGNLYDDGERVRLVDVGNAETVGPAGVVKLRGSRGTRGFTPPEMENERRADARSDVWGLGRMVAFVRTGRMFRSSPALADVVEGLTLAERSLVERLCAECPSERPPDVTRALALIEATFT
ncbi:MAG: protein kinase [Candidatus Thermoplasmatota archaeon]